jgi:hypothetical protein
MRIQRGLSIHAASKRARVSWRTWERVEAGDPQARLSTLCTIGDAVGLDLVVQAYVGRLPTLRDSEQMELAGWLTAQASATLTATIEHEVGTIGQSIDVVTFGPHEIIAIEIERIASDFQAQFRRAHQKRTLLADLHQRPVRLVIAIEDTRHNRAALEPHARLIATALPGRPREVIRALRSGVPLERDGLLWLRRPSRRARSASDQSKVRLGARTRSP